MNTIKYILITIITISMATSAYAQSTGDILYNRGIDAQKTMSSSSQRNAIECFEKAKVAYQSADNKAKCDQQISKCKKNLESIKRSNEAQQAKIEGDDYFHAGETYLMSQKYSEALFNFNKAKEYYTSQKDKDRCQTQINLCYEELRKLETAETEPVTEVIQVEDHISIFKDNEDITNNLQFRFKSGRDQNVTLKVKTSSGVWSYENNSPSWLNVSKDESSSSITLLVPRNKGEFRSALVKVTSGNASVLIIVTQDNASKFTQTKEKLKKRK